MQTSHVVAPLVVVGLGALVVLAVRGHAQMKADARALDESLVDGYCRLVAEARYDEAYRGSLSASFRQRLTAAQFSERLAKRRAELGPLLGRTLVTIQSSGNLFSGERTFQLKYVLRYASGEQVRVLSTTDADGAPRVDGTWVEAPTETLDFDLF